MNKQTEQDKYKPKIISKGNPSTSNKCNLKVDYSVVAPNKETDRATNVKTTIRIHSEFSKIFTGIRSFKGTFSLKVKDDAKPYQVLPRHINYALQELFQKSLSTRIAGTGTIRGR